jgi:hypothetical protein
MFIRYVPPWGVLHVQRNEMGRRELCVALAGVARCGKKCATVKMQNNGSCSLGHLHFLGLEFEIRR